MCYTDLGVGHSAMLRRITRDCLGSQAALAAQANGTGDVTTTDEDADEETGDGEGCEECDDGQEDSDVEDSDSEGLNELSNGELGDDDDDDDDHISF